MSNDRKIMNSKIAVSFHLAWTLNCHWFSHESIAPFNWTMWTDAQPGRPAILKQIFPFFLIIHIAICEPFRIDGILQWACPPLGQTFTYVFDLLRQRTSFIVFFFKLAFSTRYTCERAPLLRGALVQEPFTGVHTRIHARARTTHFKRHCYA